MAKTLTDVTAALAQSHDLMMKLSDAADRARSAGISFTVETSMLTTFMQLASAASDLAAALSTHKSMAEWQTAKERELTRLQAQA
jgi:hypothetical protein